MYETQIFFQIWIYSNFCTGHNRLCIQSASEKSKLAPEFLTASAFQEGLNKFIDEDYYNNPNSPLTSNAVLGLINFGGNVDGLKNGGFLRKDFNEGIEYTIQEGYKLTYPTCQKPLARDQRLAANARAT